MEDIKEIAVSLYGSDLSDSVYIDALAADLDMSESGIRKWWFGQRQVSGAARVALKLLLLERNRRFGELKG
jgi:DNA-binding transcriptional regulator YiaG